MALKEEKEFVISGKQKFSVREETDAVSDTRVMIMPQKKTRTHCRHTSRVTLRSPCEYWHPPECQCKKMKRVVRLETSGCSRITRLMNNQTRSQRKATFPAKEEKATTKNAVAIANIEPQLGCVSQDSEALVSL